MSGTCSDQERSFCENCALDPKEVGRFVEATAKQIPFCCHLEGMDFMERLLNLKNGSSRARLNENPGFTGTIANIVVYTRWGNHYIRTKSTLTGKRVKKDPVFKNTMAEAGFLGQGFPDCIKNLPGPSQQTVSTIPPDRNGSKAIEGG